MDLEDLKRSWAAHDAKLDQSIRLNTQALRGGILGKTEASLRWLSWEILFELSLNLLAPICLGVFIGDHWTETRFLVPALVLHVCAIALLIANAHQLAAVRTIDYGSPIVEIQKRLESLRIERIRTTKWTLLAAPLLWPPLLIVGMKGLFGIDAYAAFGGAFLAANALFGLGVMLWALWISRRYADRIDRSPFVRRLMRSLAGHSLTRAAGFLDSLARFENEGATS
jgi:hypothetical protein